MILYGDGDILDLLKLFTKFESLEFCIGKNCINYQIIINLHTYIE